MSGLASRLRQRREERGIAQAELAQRLGVTQQTVSRWESGEAIPRPSRLAQLADALSLNPISLQREAGYLSAEAAVRDNRFDLRGMTEGELLSLLEHIVAALRERRGLMTRAQETDV